jgi:hypothetical protein
MTWVGTGYEARCRDITDRDHSCLNDRDIPNGHNRFLDHFSGLIRVPSQARMTAPGRIQTKHIAGPAVSQRCGRCVGGIGQIDDARRSFGRLFGELP